MDASNVISIIANVGYPIAMSLLLLCYMREIDKTHDEEVANLRTALENNTIVMQQLVDKLNV